jgi:hypothetical protein
MPNLSCKLNFGQQNQALLTDRALDPGSLFSHHLQFTCSSDFRLFRGDYRRALEVGPDGHDVARGALRGGGGAVGNTAVNLITRAENSVPIGG